MTFTTIPSHPYSRDCSYLKTGEGCHWCCSACHYGHHACGCGTPLTHLGTSRDGTRHECTTEGTSA